MLHRIFIKENATPELLRCIAALMHHPYIGQTKFEILTYHPRITKYAALLLPVSRQHPDAIICIRHENGTELNLRSGHILSVAFLMRPHVLNPDIDRILSQRLTQTLSAIHNPDTLNDSPLIRSLKIELHLLHIRQKLLPRSVVPTAQERS